MKKTERKLTWADLKKVANDMPEQILNQQVTVWTNNGESGYRIKDVEILDEDYLDNGDENCEPRSIVEKYEDYNKLDHPVIHPKGIAILIG